MLKTNFKTRKVILNGQIVRVDGREVAVRFANSEDEIKTFVDTFNAYPHLLHRRLMELTPAGAFEPWRPVSDGEAIAMVDALARLVGP